MASKSSIPLFVSLLAVRHRYNHDLDLAPSFFRGRAGEVYKGALHALNQLYSRFFVLIGSMFFEAIVDSCAGSPSNSPLKPKGEDQIELAETNTIKPEVQQYLRITILTKTYNTVP